MQSPTPHVPADRRPLPQGDPFTEHVFASLPAEVRASFSAAQSEALRKVLGRVHDRSRHMLDVRAVIPLYFMRFYVVFLFGEDRRRQTREVLLERRQAASSGAKLALVAGTLWVTMTLLAVGTFLLLYALKAAVGIDLFPDSHLRDWLPF